MARKKNVVSKRIIETGDVASMLQVANYSLKTAKQLKQFNRDVVTPLEYNIRARALFPMLLELRTYPAKRPAGSKVRWKSEKQRKYVMMLLRATDNIPYKRTFKLKRGWRYEIKRDNQRGALRVRVWNEAQSYDPIKNKAQKYHRFVTGDIGLGVSTRSIERYIAPIQPFHQDTGWKPSYPIIQKYILLAGQEARNVYQKRIEKIVKG